MRMILTAAWVTLALAAGCGQGRMPISPPGEAASAVQEDGPDRLPESDGVEPVAFEDRILPILDKCAPCHFEGGKMYSRLPFDDPQTIRELGEALFTRIKDEEEQAVIRAFLAQSPASSSPDAD